MLDWHPNQAPEFHRGFFLLAENCNGRSRGPGKTCRSVCEESFPRGLKPTQFLPACGTAKAMPCYKTSRERFVRYCLKPVLFNLTHYRTNSLSPRRAYRSLHRIRSALALAGADRPLTHSARRAISPACAESGGVVHHGHAVGKSLADSGRAPNSKREQTLAKMLPDRLAHVAVKRKLGIVLVQHVIWPNRVPDAGRAIAEEGVNRLYARHGIDRGRYRNQNRGRHLQGATHRGAGGRREIDENAVDAGGHCARLYWRARAPARDAAPNAIPVPAGRSPASGWEGERPSARSERCAAFRDEDPERRK